MPSSVDRHQLVVSARDKTKGVLGGISKQIAGLGAAYFGAKGLLTAVTSIIDKGSEHQRVWMNVTGALKRHNIEAVKGTKQIQEFADEMQTLTGISDELIGTGIQQFIDYGASIEEAKETMRIAADLAAGQGMQLKATVDLLAKAQVGYTGTLSRYGIILDESIPKEEKFAEALQQINDRFGGAAQDQAKSFSVKIKALSEKFGDLQENIFKAAESTGLMEKAVDGLSDSIDGLNTYLGQELDAWDLLQTLIAFNVGGIDAYIQKSKELLNLVNVGDEPEGPAFLNYDIPKALDELDEFEVALTGVGETFKFTARTGVEAFNWAMGLMKTKAGIGAKAIMNAEKQKRAAFSDTAKVSDEIGQRMVAGMGRTSGRIVSDMIRNKKSIDDIWKSMAASFGDLFLDTILTSLLPGSSFVKSFLGSFKFWDIKANDDALIREGQRAWMFIEDGIKKAMKGFVPDISAAPRFDGGNYDRNVNGGGSGIVINFYGPVTNTDFVRNTVVPVIEEAIERNRSSIVKTGFTITGTEYASFN